MKVPRADQLVLDPNHDVLHHQPLPDQQRIRLAAVARALDGRAVSEELLGVLAGLLVDELNLAVLAELDRLDADRSQARPQPAGQAAADHHTLHDRLQQLDRRFDVLDFHADRDLFDVAVDLQREVLRMLFKVPRLCEPTTPRVDQRGVIEMATEAGCTTRMFETHRRTRRCTSQQSRGRDRPRRTPPSAAHGCTHRSPSGS